MASRTYHDHSCVHVSAAEENWDCGQEQGKAKKQTKPIHKMDVVSKMESVFVKDVIVSLQNHTMESVFVKMLLVVFRITLNV